MTTVDGLLRIPITLAWRDLSSTFEWAHVSAHFADGVRKMDDPPPDPGTWSREYVRWVATWENGWIRPYAGYRHLIHVLPQAPRPGVQVGYSVWGPWRVAPYHALDAQWNADSNWHTTIAAQAGVALGGGSGPRVLLGGVGRRGPDDTGKRTGADERYLGVVLAFPRIHGAPMDGGA